MITIHVHSWFIQLKKTSNTENIGKHKYITFFKGTPIALRNSGNSIVPEPKKSE